MSVRTWLAERIRPRNAGSVAPTQPAWLLRHPMLAEAGVTITTETAIQVSAVYGCCRLIVDSLAAAPIRVIEIKSNGRHEVLHDDPVAYTLDHGAPIASAPDAPTAQAIEEALLWSSLLDGNGYAEIQRDNSGRFFALWPIEPWRVQPWRDESGFHYRVSAPSSGMAPSGGWTRLEARDCFHVRGPSLMGWVGDSTVYRASKAIGIGQAAQVYAAAYFANGTILSGLLTSDKVINPKQADDAREQWNERHGGGPGKQHGISVLGQGIKFQPINHNAAEAQLVEARRFQVAEIARFFGVPTTLLADNEAWTNLSELYLGFYRNALLPWAERFDAEATRKLFPQRQPWREVRHDLTHLTLGSFKDQVLALKMAVDGGLWTRNEAREVLGKNHIGADGDAFVVEGKIQSLENVLRPAEPAGEQPIPGADPKTPGAGPEEPDGGTPAPVKKRPALSAREAIVAMFADAFARHSRRIANHKAKHKGVVSEEDRSVLRTRLIEDCAAALELAQRAGTGAVDLGKFSDAIEQGEPADKAAERCVVAILEPRPGDLQNDPPAEMRGA